MLRLEQQNAHEEGMITIPTIEERNSIKTSMLYHVLPAIVQSRIPTLPSFRRSIRGLHSKANSLPELPRPATPPPDYTSRPGSGTTTPYRTPVGGAVFEFADDISEAAESSADSSAPLCAAFEKTTGINWQYARHGVSMMTQARRHASSSADHNDDEATPTLTRSLYVQGVAWLLQGLPTDLTPNEAMSLRAVIPHSVVDTQNDERAQALMLNPRGSLKQRQASAPAQAPTVVHRVTAIVVFYTFLLIEMLLPWVKIFVAHAYQFEKEHQVTRRILDTSLTTVNRLSQSVYQMNDGLVGQAINDASFWLVRGVASGIQQGVEDRQRMRRARGTGKVE